MARNKADKEFRRKERNRRFGKKSYPEYTGKVQMTREGFIFVIVEGEEQDVFVKASKTRNALNGDIVRVAVTRQGSKDKKREGEVIEIVERSNKPFVGFLHFVGAQAWVLMQSKSMPYDIQIDQQEALALGGKPGMKAAVVVDRWNRGDSAPQGHVVDVLGMPGQNETEMHAILAEFNLPYRFDKEVENAADSISEAITAKDLKGRKDFRDTLTFTIDPADAKDFDDAISFKPLSNGNYEVGVHIADVSYYVTPGTPVDKEARERGTSVYLVDRTVPMLPEKLCNKLCSLRPDEDKLTFSTVFEISPKAEIKSSWIGRTVIRSDKRFCYEEAQEVIEAAQTSEQIDGRIVPGSVPPAGRAAHGTGVGGPSQTVGSAQPTPDGALAPELRTAILSLNKLAGILRAKRFKKGAINFERPEMKVLVDENGKPVDVFEKISKEANWLIEEFMLLANRTVAEYIATDGKMNGSGSKKAKTFVYRVHGEPNTEKLAGLREFAAGFGYNMGDKIEGRAAAKTLNALLEEAKGKPECSAFQDIALRSMAKAFYSTDNIGHYGLAFPFYTHFTSPIRRYPDTMVHRLLTEYLSGGESENKSKYEEECKHASERELLAAEAERTSVKYKLVEYMQDKLGKEYDGTVSGITEWGIYVEIEPTRIEGMVSLRSIRSDYFEFDEARYRLVGKRTKKIYRLGDKVRIRVKDANLEQRLLDYELIDTI